MRHALVPLVLLALAACERGPEAGGNGAGDNEAGGIAIGAGEGNEAVTIRGDGDKLAIQTPGFSAQLNMPGLPFAPDKMDIDGMRIAAGTRMSGMRVLADDRPGAESGTVRMRFTSDQPPAALAAWYKGEAAKAGYRVGEDKGPAGFTATKTEGAKQTRFALDLHAQGAGSAGSVAITGR